MNRKKEQIQERWEFGKEYLYRRGRADSVIRLGSNLFAGEAFSACVSSSHLPYFIGISELKRLCFYKKSSGYFYFFPASGNRGYSSGNLNNSGTNGYGWTSTPNGSNAWNLNFNSGDAYTNNNNRGNGFPVRCVQASAPVFVLVKETFVFFPAAGVRRNSDGVLYYSGVEGDGWTSTPADGGCAYRFIFNSGSAYMGGEAARTYGFPVRCVQASAAVFVFIIKDFKETPVFFFPAAGYRNYNDGTLRVSGASGYGWTSASDGNGHGWYLDFWPTIARMYSNSCTYGFSVRCVQGSAAVFDFRKKLLSLFREYPNRVNDTFVFFPATGYHVYNSGRVSESGGYGGGWSSTPIGNHAWNLSFRSGGACVDYNVRTFGRSVRCVQASAAVWAVRKENIKQIRYRRESGKGILCRRGQADSVTRLGRKVFANEKLFVCAASSYLFWFIKLPVFKSLYFYKHSSGYFLFFPASGARLYSDGSLRYSGTSAIAWTSTVKDSNTAWYLDVNSPGAHVPAHFRTYGFSVRCVQASATVWTFQKENIRQIRFRWESGKACLFRRGRADSVTRLGRKLSVGHSLLPCAVPSYSISLIELPVLNDLYFYKHSSGYSLFFPASGYRNYSDGNLGLLATNGCGWTSTPGGANAWYLDFYSGNVRMLSRSRGNGFPVRCVQASATVFIFNKETFVFFPAAGYRTDDGGLLYASGTEGRAWSSTPVAGSENAWYLYWASTGARMDTGYCAVGRSVRCVQASAAVFVFIKETFVFFPASGCRDYRIGNLLDSGSNGYGWSSTVSGDNACYLYFSLGAAYIGVWYRDYGRPVRCVQASAAVFAFTKETFVFFPAAGYRHYSNGNFYNLGTWGYWWTSTPENGGKAWRLHVESGSCRVVADWCSYGFPVRCVQASATVWAVPKENIKQIRYRRESGKVRLCRRGQADSVTRLGRKLSARHSLLSCAVPSYSISLIKLPVFAFLYFYKHSSGYFLFFPASGFRNYSDAKLLGSGGEGDGWTSTPSGGGGSYLRFQSGIAHVSNSSRGYGFPVRCVQASATVFTFVKETFVFFPAAGVREYTDGRLYNSGTEGDGWTSVPDGNNAFRLIFKSGYAYVTSVTRTYGFPVRCVQASAAVWIVSLENTEQIRYRREFGKARLCRRGRADSVTRLGRKLSAGNACLPGAAPSHVSTLIRILGFIRLCFYKHSSGYSLFFPATGFRTETDGSRAALGIAGRAWTLSPGTGNDAAWYLGLVAEGAYLGSGLRTVGRSVRCVQASAAVLAFTKDTFVFFPAAGHRYDGDGKLYYSGVEGDAWTSVPDGGSAFRLMVKSGYAYVTSVIRGYGFPVRCVQASAAVFAFTKDTLCFFPAAGYRFSSSGSLVALGTRGYGWGSDPYDGSRAWGLFLGAEGTNMYYDSRAYGFSVRCVQASAAVSAFIKETFVFFPASGVRSFDAGILYNGGVEGCGWSSVPYDANLAYRFRLYSAKAFVGGADRDYGFPVRCVQASATVFTFVKETFIFFPAAGRRDSGNGSLGYSGRYGYGWASTPNGSYAYRLLFSSGDACVSYHNRADGFPVRCVQASATVFTFAKETFVFFPAAGYRSYIDGRLLGSGGEGDGWTSTSSGSGASYFRFLSDIVHVNNNARGNGFPVRCVQASATVFTFAKETFVFFPVSGFRGYGSGPLNNSGTSGYGWTSTTSGATAWYLDIWSTNARMYNGHSRECGFPVRCVQASAAVWVVRKENTKQIRYRRESGKGTLCRRGRADSVTYLGRKLFASANRFVCVVPSYSISLIELPAFKCPYFYKHSSGYFLFFPASGHRSATTGELTVSGARGDVLSSTTSGATAWYLYFSSGAAYMSNYERVGGRSVRCVQASAIVFAFTERIQADFFPASGYRDRTNGRLSLSGWWGYGWTSVTYGGEFAWDLNLSSGKSRANYDYRGNGLTVRCVQASAAVFAFWGKFKSVSCFRRSVIKDMFAFFPASGYRHHGDGKLYLSGTNGYVWSSTLIGGKAYNLTFGSGGANMHPNENRGHGFSVRCVQASAIVFVCMVLLLKINTMENDTS